MARELVTSLQLSRSGTVRVTPAGSDSAIDDVKAGRADAALIARSLTAEETRSFMRSTTPATACCSLSTGAIRCMSWTRQRSVASFRAKFRTGSSSATRAPAPLFRSPVARVTVRATFDNAFGIGRVIPTGIVELATNLAAVLYVAADPQAIGYVSADAYGTHAGAACAFVPCGSMASFRREGAKAQLPAVPADRFRATHRQAGGRRRADGTLPSEGEAP